MTSGPFDPDRMIVANAAFGTASPMDLDACPMPMDVDLDPVQIGSYAGDRAESLEQTLNCVVATETETVTGMTTVTITALFPQYADMEAAEHHFNIWFSRLKHEIYSGEIVDE